MIIYIIYNRVASRKYRPIIIGDNLPLKFLPIIGNPNISICNIYNIVHIVFLQ